ncbi:hypothetical protein J4G43_027835 [Bradyrhizobium barranii subsp. barranii]|uniref:Uncharacterized protein n=1 Tax=Bradyrhizobium barranii subsp. barranii TaxID=2823807 RepID=A0A939M999_9BRAD|nr:hypothetical protein [Bradyrhizobium barranii]UEM08582.1 hypothetical protein J4G43_027835 [Bradyrhizobium barranii subsp. barranii]
MIDTDPIFLSIDWTPRDRPNDAKSDLFVKLTQGTIEESGTREFRSEIQDRKSAYVTIKRDPFQRTQILIRVNDKNLQVQIPARSRMKLVKNILSSMDPPGVSYGTGTVETSGNIGGPVCVRIPNDAQDKFIIPESFKIISYRDQRQRVTRNDRMTVSNEREVCAQIDVVFDTVFKSYAYMDIRGTAEVMMAVPNN